MRGYRLRHGFVRLPLIFRTVTLDEAKALLTGAIGASVTATQATQDQGWMGKGGSQARRWRCSGGDEYAVKHLNNPQVTGGATHLLATEVVVALLARVIGAPVPPAAVVDVAPELVDGLTYQGTTTALQAGRSFGSEIVGHGVDQDGADPAWRNSQENRPRFAAIAVLHLVFTIGDGPQFVYELADPHPVWSIDHGYFMGNGAWTAAMAMDTAVDIAAHGFADLGFSEAELRTAALPLFQLDGAALAGCVAPVPAEWVPDVDVRAACLCRLAGRREALEGLLTA